MNRKTPFVLALLLTALSAFGQTQTIDWSKIRNKPTEAGTPGYGILLPNKGFPCRFGTGTGPAQTCTLGSGLTVNTTTGAVDVSAGGVGTVTSVQCGAGLTGGTITTAGVCAADIGTGAGQLAAGNDARLSDTRTPTDGSVTNAKVAAGAAIAESKLALASDGLPGDATRRSLGTGAQQAAQGSTAVQKGAITASGLTLTGPAVLGKITGTGAPEVIPLGANLSFSAGQLVASGGSTGGGTPPDGSVRDLQVASDAAIAESKLALVTDAAAGVGSRRTLGTGALQAAPGATSVQKGPATASGLTLTTNRLLGRSTTGTGAPEEITLGSNLSFSGTTLNATGGSGGTGYLLSTMQQSNTAEQNRVALLSDIKAAIAANRSLYIACGICAVSEIEINGTTNNSTTAALGEGAKLHIVIDDATTILTQVGSKLIDIELAGNTIAITPSAMDFVGGTNTINTGPIIDPPFYAGRYLRLTVPDAMVNPLADPTTVVNKYDMVTLQDATPQVQNESGVNEGYQAELFEVLEVFEVTGSADDYVYISIPLKTYNLATTRLQLWKNKDTEFSVTGGRFKGDPASGDFESKTLTRSTTTSIVFDVSGIKAPTFRNVRVSDTFTGFAQIQSSMLAEFDNVQGERARNQSNPNSPNDYRALSYMVDFYGANKNFRITNSGGNGFRHVFTTNTNQATSYTAANWPVYGETVGGHLDGYRGTFGQGGSIDTHDPSYGLRISNAIVMSPVEYSDGIISPRCFSDRAASSTFTNVQCYGAGNLLTMDGWKLNHYNADNTTTINGAAFLRPLHIPGATQEDVPVIEATGRSGITERRKLIVNDLQIEDFGTWLSMDPDGGEAVLDNLSFKGDIYRLSTTGRPGFLITGNNRLTIKNTTLDFRTASTYSQTLAVNNALIKAFGSMVGSVELTLDNVTILGCSKFDDPTTHRLFANDGTGTKTVRYRNFYCDDPDVVISGGTGVTLVNMDPSAGGSLTDGDKGDITVSGSGAAWTVKTVTSNKGGAGPQRNRIAFIGDSITAAGKNPGSTTQLYRNARGYMTWLNFYCGQCFETDTSLNFGVGGYSTTDVIAQLPSIIAAAPDVATVLIGTNDLPGTGRTVALITADLNTIYQTLGAAGIKVVAIPILPRAGSAGSDWTGLTTAETTVARNKLNGVNNYIRQYNLSNPTYKIIVAETYKYDVDYASATGDPFTAQRVDGLHPNIRGHERIGYALFEAMGSILPSFSYRQWLTPSDVFDATNNTRGSLLTNGFMAGTGGSAGTGTSGSVATSWGLSRSGSNVTAVGSKQTVGADGSTAGAQRIVASTTGTSGTGTLETITLTQTVSTNIAAGDTVIAACSLSGRTLTGNNLVSSQMRLSNAGGTSQNSYGMGGTGLTDLMPTIPYTGSVSTDPLTMPAGVTSVTVRFEIEMDATKTGSVQMDLSRCSLRKIN